MKRGECSFVLTYSDLSAHDLAELEKFTSCLKIEASRRAGGDPAALNVLEGALYPEGVGRLPIDGMPDA